MFNSLRENCRKCTDIFKSKTEEVPATAEEVQADKE